MASDISKVQPLAFMRSTRKAETYNNPSFILIVLSLILAATNPVTADKAVIKHHDIGLKFPEFTFAGAVAKSSML